MGDPEVFKGLYKEAANVAASFYGYEPEISDTEIRKAWGKFVQDFGRFQVSKLKPMKALKIATALLIRAAAAFPITTYGRTVRTGNVVRYDRRFARDYCNELTALTFGISVLSVELSRVYRGQNYYSVNLDGLKLIKPYKIRTYVEMVLDDRQLNFNQRRGMFRKDFYSLMEIVNIYLMKDLPR
ncbi:hypothetical protein QTA58_23420 [Neorhizobium sp. CSC1952]|uniref:hypothetical protein n=1 Tax=Neorhizobium sp. CSC1952 TaxID=2978974 RepID=UPI0025A65221|nr:hypothetical protein [Rhizobium sp. CSC1952]WJR67092.1 hypothetical protein QTA58_23420 [Rhizobium sp. CSC1952]